MKLGSITPVVASKAKIRLRVTSSAVLEKVAEGLTEVNVPAATILLPIWVMPMTEPFMTCGVLFAGIAETTRSPWLALTASAAGAVSMASPTVEANRAAVVRRGRCIRPPWSGSPTRWAEHWFAEPTEPPRSGHHNSWVKNVTSRAWRGAHLTRFGGRS